MGRLAFVVAMSLSALSVTAACGEGKALFGGGTTGTATGSGGAGGAGAAGGSASTGDPTTTTTTTSVGGAGGTSNTCATNEHEIVDATLDMYLMMDRSGSMAGANWTNLSNAVDVVMDAMPEDTGIAFVHYPVDTGIMCPVQCGPTTSCGASCGQCVMSAGFGFCEGPDICNVADYDTPDLGLALLPGAATTILGLMALQTQEGGSPLYPVIQGGISYARTLANQAPDHETVILLATDWGPTVCDPMDQNSLEILAATAQSGNPPVKLFTAGVGDNLFGLDAIAAAGGTEQAYVVNAVGNQVDSLIDALLDVRRDGRDCTFAIPNPAGDGEVVVTGEGNPIPSVANQAACNDGEGWYRVGDEVALCRASCRALEDGDTVEIAVGCSE